MGSLEPMVSDWTGRVRIGRHASIFTAEMLPPLSPDRRWSYIFGAKLTRRRRLETDAEFGRRSQRIKGVFVGPSCSILAIEQVRIKLGGKTLRPGPGPGTGRTTSQPMQRRPGLAGPAGRAHAI
jgi:hypothetical protein